MYKGTQGTLRALAVSVRVNAQHQAATPTTHSTVYRQRHAGVSRHTLRTIPNCLTLGFTPSFGSHAKMNLRNLQHQCCSCEALFSSCSALSCILNASRCRYSVQHAKDCCHNKQSWSRCQCTCLFMCTMSAQSCSKARPDQCGNSMFSLLQSALNRE